MMMETVPSGTILNRRYRIERVLGSGGFGHVYLALDLNTNQQYALKEYFVTGSSGQAQLQHEAKVLSQLHHPNLPAFHEAFNERGHYFVVLSYIEGNDLTDLIRVARRSNEPIPLARVMGWILSVCDAVQFLHSQQPVVIHRDIKPDNIRIMPDGTAILVDLGNAKATADGARTLFFIRHQGTPGYAPQEQYPGGTGTDVRSDVYALGATLYFALTSQEPPSVSTRNQSIQQGLPDLPSLQEQLANNPPPESAEANAARQFRLGVTKPSKPAPRHIRHLAQLGKLPPELLDQLNRIIKRAMAMKQKDRYPSIAEFGNDLRKVVAALPAQIASTPPPSRPSDPNSTQPDLPLLYEAVQAAKANVDQSLSTTVPDQPTQPMTCPRCGTALVQQATFCPGCGSALNSLFKGNTSEPGNIHKASSQNKPPAHDFSLDQTMVIKPQAKVQTQAQVQTSTPTIPKPKPEFYPSTKTPPGVNMVPSPSMKQRQNMSTTGNPPQVSSVQPGTRRNSPARITGFTIKPRTIIILAVILVILLVILLVLLFIIHSHANQALHNINPGFATQVMYHERTFSFNGVASTTPVATGIWTCGPGASPTAGIAE
jgi:serine/threonine protein kinase